MSTSLKLKYIIAVDIQLIRLNNATFAEYCRQYCWACAVGVRALNVDTFHTLIAINFHDLLLLFDIRPGFVDDFIV